MELFEQAVGGSGVVPLATRMRPGCLGELIGQEHLLGEGALLPRLLKGDNFGSILLYGPPGCGKTSLAEVIAAEVDAKFVRVNAVLSNVAEMRDILRMARYDPGAKTVLFVDEIHRFNKAQQDLLLPDVEAGHVRLIGATTHNPGFYVIPPLISRSHLFRLEPLKEEEVVRVLERALGAEKGLKNQRVEVEGVVLEGLARIAGGDLRRALNALETLVMSQPMGSVVGEEALEVFARERQIRYDRDEDEHYDTISAFIKSVRGSDPDAALYWLCKMLEGGEDPRFIARRLVILASEDVGLADSRGLPLAMAAFEACDVIGMPECGINLSHVTVFLATAPKSNASYMAYNRAMKEVKGGAYQEVPLWLRDGSKAVSKKLGYGEGYLYSHDFEENITGQEYMVEPKRFYEPKGVGAEAAVGERLERWRALKNSFDNG